MYSYYWREKLKKREQKLYDKLMNSFYSFKEQVSCANFSLDKLNKIYEAITYDHPELYYLPSKIQIAQTINIWGTKTELILHNLFSRNQINRYDTELEKIKSEFADKISFCKNDFEREKVVCEYIIENITYKLNNVFNQNAATVLVNKIGQCSGIAKAVKLLLNWCGINAIVVSGFAMDTTMGKMLPHAWNIVNINGKNFHLDVTFMLGANNRKVKPYNLVYYNYSDNEMIKTHQWNTSEIPVCNESYKDGIVVNDINRTSLIKVETIVNTSYELSDLLEEAILQGKKMLSFESRITVASNDLMAIIQNCCQIVIDKNGLRESMTITIQGSLVQIMW